MKLPKEGAFDFDLRRDPMFEQIADQIQRLIISESLRPGDRLPSERRLAERLSVSRSVIREAIGALKARGLLEARPGSGTYIQRPSSVDGSAYLGLLLSVQQLKDRYRHLTEVRWALEVEIASLAAERAEPNDIADLEAALSGIKTDAHDVDQFISYDLAFHSALAAATHNEVYRVFMMLIVELLSEFRLKACHQDFCGTLMDTSTHYALIVRHIKNHNPVETRTAVREYLHYNQGLEESVLAS